MRSHSSLAALGAVASTALLLVAFVFLSPTTLFASERPEPSGSPVEPPAPPLRSSRDAVASRAPTTARLDDLDAITALDAVRIALTEVGDGGTYVWHRRDGLLSGTAQPTTSFKTRDGQPCRHIVVTLQSKDLTRSAEGIACRLSNGRWQLDG